MFPVSLPPWPPLTRGENARLKLQTELMARLVLSPLRFPIIPSGFFLRTPIILLTQHPYQELVKRNSNVGARTYQAHNMLIPT